MIPDSFIEQLKYANPVEEVVGSYVTLKRRGRTLVGLCPFHLEKTPSFTVYPDSQSFYCFGCGSGGDTITFIRNIENLEYLEALRLLAARAGMTLPEDGTDDHAARLKSRVLEVNRESARFFYSRLKSDAGKNTLAYLQKRGLTAKTIKHFGLGYAADGWNGLRDHLSSKGFKEDEMLAAAVVKSGNNSTYDAFRNRVMFPIIDLRGNVIGFGGRALEDRGPKYLNSADTPVFKKSRNLFALNFAKNAGADTIILAEGYMDVIAIHQAGFENAVATLGTALTAEQAQLLSTYAKKVAIAYDSDAAGQEATRRAINLLGETDVAVSVLEIPGAKDPDEYIKKYGPERFGTLISGGKGAVRFEIDKLMAKYDLDEPEDKSTFLNEFCKLMADIRSDLQRDVYISETARELDVGRDAIVTTIRSLRKKRQNSDAKKSAHNLRIYVQDKAGNRMQPRSGDLRSLVAEEKLIALLMKNPDSYDRIRDRIRPEDFQSEQTRAIYEAVAERLAANQTPELIHLSARLEPGLMARLTGLLARARDIVFLPGQAEEYCAAIRAAQEVKTTQEVQNMSPEEYKAYISSLAAKKK